MSSKTFISDLHNHFTDKYKLSIIKTSNSNIDSSVSIIIREINTNFEILFIKRTIKKKESSHRY